MNDHDADQPLSLLVVVPCLNEENTVGRVVSGTAAEMVAAGQSGGLDVGDTIGKFYADFFFVVNIVGVLMQLFVVSRVRKYLGVRVALMILPCIALGGYAILFAMPLLYCFARSGAFQLA